jgi:hypothetical protein
MHISTIERSPVATDNALGGRKKLDTQLTRGKIIGAIDRHKIRPPHGSARRWQSLFASFLRRSS